ncbi:MAG: TetR/AcrR family transcriptional regulator [bacterium]|nr:TetR/AcrR family transcriptional regulator [bacterium]
MANSNMTSSAPNRSGSFDAKLERVLAAGSAVIAREGFGQATIRQVASEANMSLAGLYHYFSSKDELLFLIQFHTFSAIVDQLSDRLEGVDPPHERLRVMVSNHLDHFLARMNDLKVCAREMESLNGEYFGQVEALRHRYFAITLEIIEALRDEVGSSHTEPRLATLYLFGMLNWIYMWYPDEEKMSEEILTQQLISLFLNGFLPTE